MKGAEAMQKLRVEACVWPSSREGRSSSAGWAFSRKCQDLYRSIAVSRLLVSWGSKRCDGRPAGLEELAVCQAAYSGTETAPVPPCTCCPLGPIRSLAARTVPDQGDSLVLRRRLRR